MDWICNIIGLIHLNKTIKAKFWRRIWDFYLSWYSGLHFLMEADLNLVNYHWSKYTPKYYWTIKSYQIFAHSIHWSFQLFCWFIIPSLLIKSLYWFGLQERPKWMKISSLDELKTKVGHVIVMILLVKMFERSKMVAIATGMDLLSYSICIFLSSASLYILHQLHKPE